MSDRKREHIELTFKSRTTAVEADSRFIYEPLLSEHPTELTPKGFLGKTLRTPIWVCSMTGGTELAKKTAKTIAADFNTNVVGTAGIHWDDLPEEGIRRVVENTEILVDLILRRIRSELGKETE